MLAPRADQVADRKGQAADPGRIPRPDGQIQLLELATGGLWISSANEEPREIDERFQRVPRRLRSQRPSLHVQLVVLSAQGSCKLGHAAVTGDQGRSIRSEEHTSELQSRE